MKVCLSVIKESGTEFWCSLVVLRIYSNSLSSQVIKLHRETVGTTTIDCESLTALVTVIVSSIYWVCQVEFSYIVLGVFKSQGYISYISRFTQLKSSKAHFFDRTWSSRVEEIYLVDVHLIVNSVDKVRVNSFLKISQGFEVWYFPKSDHVIVEKLNSASWPTMISIYLNSYWFCIYSCEVKCCHSCGHRSWNLEDILNSDEFSSIKRVFKVKLCDITCINSFKLKGVECGGLSSQSNSYKLVLVCSFGFPSFRSESF